MTDIELTPPALRTSSRVDDIDRSTLTLPHSMDCWVAALLLFPTIDRNAYELAAQVFGNGTEPGWAFFSTILVRSGMARQGPTPGTYRFLPAWEPLLEQELEELGGPEATRVRLIEQWLRKHDRALMAPIASWARELERWDVLESIWLIIDERTSGTTIETLEVFRDLPVRARRSRPILTWASGAAASMLARNEQPDDPVWERVQLDSATLHADWAARANTDEAVAAGTFRMIGERRLPGTHPGQSLDAAWRTKQEVDAFIDARSRAGDPPGRTSHSIFRAFSSRLALFRFDPFAAIDEARWANILADSVPIHTVSAGVQALALSITSDGGPAHPASRQVLANLDDQGVQGLHKHGQVFELLANGNDAVRRLDRAGVDRGLKLVNVSAAALSGVWAPRVALEAWRAALWGDVSQGLDTMSADIQRFSWAGREQEEAFGGFLLTRIRVVLLIRCGAFAEAERVARALPDNVATLSKARIQLWAGRYDQAIRLADAGRHQLDLGIVDRGRLRLIRAAALILAGNVESELPAEVGREMRRVLETGSFLNIGLLPPAARTAVMEGGFELDAPSKNLALLQQRLGDLNDFSDEILRPPLRLTEREALLLPMLASPATTPEIARKLYVSVNTVRKQVVSLRKKFEASTRAELIRKARIHGLIP